MRKFAIPLTFVGAMFSLILPATTAQAQATRTWVSGVGDDVNPCSRTAPCKTFAGAISKTAANGEINCIDPGGFGTVTITKSITIDCSGTFGSILASGTNGVNINTAGTTVKLRGLSIQGANTGLIGVNITGTASVMLENLVISGFKAGTALGVFVKPTGVGGTNVTLNRVTMQNNIGGLFVDSTLNPGLVSVAVKDSVASGNTNAGFEVSAGTTGIRAIVESSHSVNNGFGVKASGVNSGIIIGDTTVSANGTGIIFGAGPGKIFTYKNNNINGNTVDGTPTQPPIVQN